MKFDDASWHVNSVEVETDDPYPIASGHIVAYLQWCLKRCWAGELHTKDEESVESLENVLKGNISFTKFFEDCCDCKFTDENLNDEGNEFTKWYYEEKYYDDIMTICGDHIFSKPGEEYDLEKLNKHLDNVYHNWKNKEPNTVDTNKQ